MVNQVILALAKSSGTPYKMIFHTPSDTTWSEIKRKLQEVYYLVATDVHAVTDLLRKQCADESIFSYWTEMCHQSMKHNPMTIDNKLVIKLFIMNLYDIR